MTEFFNLGLDHLLRFLDQGLLNWSGWSIVAYTLITTHITIAAVTIYLHRHQAHRALDLHWLPAHFFRLWLWLATGMQTKAWAAIHRKHHAKCETPEDPHSPQTRGLKTVFWRGAELYRSEANNAETLSKYGHGTPNDWVENHVYSRFPWQGVGIMLIINLLLFGAIGLTVWAVQMLWIPVTAAGIINGVGHYWGYRNFEAPDASTNISPWGIIIGGEELHNNHHTYPTSAKLSVKPYEFDIGWAYITILSKLGLAKVKKTPPKLAYGDIQPVADEKTLETLIANRYEVMAAYARQLRAACRQDIQSLKQRPTEAVLQAARRWMHRDIEKIPDCDRTLVDQARATLPQADTMVRMREELRQLWLSTHRSREQLASDLQAWCRRAEGSGVAALRDFSMRLRAAHT
jgi:stearoyl-CoA desaturase (delta-9 desaturase)